MSLRDVFESWKGGKLNPTHSKPPTPEIHDGVQTKELPDTLYGRVLRGKYDKDFETLSDNPERRVVFFTPDSELRKIKDIPTGYGKMIEIGWTESDIEDYVQAGKKFKLLEFPSDESVARPATWDNVIDVVSEAYPEFAEKLQKQREALKTTPYAEIFIASPQLAQPSDELRMTVERYATETGDLAQTRAFLRDTLNLNELFTGDGYTKTSEGRQGVVELIGLNRKISEIPGAKLTDIEIDLVDKNKRIPENFREGKEGYYPNRLVSKTKRVDALGAITASFTDDLEVDSAEQVKQRLYDLVIYNAYGRVYPTPNSCSDFVGVINTEKGNFVRKIKNRSKYRNCIALVTVRGNLALAGGFNDIGESMTQTVAREAGEEMGTKDIENISFFSERSNTNRDKGIVVISSCAAGLVNKSELHGGDDAAGEAIRIVKLKKNGQFNTDMIKAGTYTDVEGATFTHNGLRGDHAVLLKQLYNYWQDHRKKKKPWESLASTLKRTSKMIPQEWFGKFAEHPAGLDNYDSFTVDGRTTLLTPNIIFTLKNAEKIFEDVGVSDAKERARKFVAQCASEETDVLPPFPQAGVTVDCIVVRNNNIIVHKMPDGSYRLPGSFYSPEKVQAGASLAQFANGTIARRFGGTDFIANMYLGTVGGEIALGHQADNRFPRLSHIYVGTTTGEYETNPTGMPEGVEVVEIPIWKDDSHTALSSEITDNKWGFEHNKEILEPLFGRALIYLQENKEGATAEDLVMQERLAL